MKILFFKSWNHNFEHYCVPDKQYLMPPIPPHLHFYLSWRICYFNWKTLQQLWSSSVDCSGRKHILVEHEINMNMLLCLFHFFSTFALSCFVRTLPPLTHINVTFFLGSWRSWTTSKCSQKRISQKVVRTIHCRTSPKVCDVSLMSVYSAIYLYFLLIVCWSAGLSVCFSYLYTCINSSNAGM